MEQLQGMRTLRLRSAHGKYLWADEDGVSVYQHRDRDWDRDSSSSSSSHVVWEIVVVEQGGSSQEEGCAAGVVRLRSCWGGYLTATSEPFLLGMTGRKVQQTSKLDSSVEWEPLLSDTDSTSEPPLSSAGAYHHHIRFKTRHGNFLRANGGVPPWRNSVTHDVPVRSATQSWVVWLVEMVEPRLPPKLPSSLASKLEVNLSFKIPKAGGRVISYAVAGDAEEEKQFEFKGHTVEELACRLKEELGMDEDEKDIVLCTRQAATGALYPLKLALPPSNTPVRLVVLVKRNRDER